MVFRQNNLLQMWHFFSQKSRDFARFCDSVIKFGQAVTQAFLEWNKKNEFPCVEFSLVYDNHKVICAILFDLIFCCKTSIQNNFV